MAARSRSAACLASGRFSDGGGIDGPGDGRCPGRLIDLEIRGAGGFVQGGLSTCSGTLRLLRCRSGDFSGGFGGGLRVVSARRRSRILAIVGNTAYRGGGGISLGRRCKATCLRILNSMHQRQLARSAVAVSNLNFTSRVEIVHSTASRTMLATNPGTSGILSRGDPGATISISNSAGRQRWLNFFYLSAPLADFGRRRQPGKPSATCFAPTPSDLAGVVRSYSALGDHSAKHSDSDPPIRQPGDRRRRPGRIAPPPTSAASPGQQGAGCGIGAFELAGPVAADVPLGSARGIGFLAALVAASGCWLLRFRR